MKTKISSILAFLKVPRLLILCLLVQAPAVFGQLSFNVTIASLTNNNTSAFTNYNKSTYGANFSGSTIIASNGHTMPVDANLMDDSLNPVSPGNVSHVSVHSLIPSNPKLRWFANSLGWFGDGESGHVKIGVDSTNYSYAVAMVNDLAARGFDGVIFSWYGWYNGVSDNTDILAKNVKKYLQTGACTNKEFHYIVMPVFGYFKGQPSGTTNLPAFESSLHYAETNYFTDTNYENYQDYTVNPISTTTNPIIMFFGVRADDSSGFNEGDMEAAHQYDTALSKSVWVEEVTGSGGGHATEAWVNQSYSWTDEWSDGTNDSGFYTDPFNQAQVGQDFKNFGIIKKPAFGSMCAHFNGSLSTWSQGKYMQSSNGLCEITRAGIYDANMATNKLITRMQWATWSDWEEGTECEDGIENWLGLTNQVSGTVLSWGLTNGYLATVDHFEIYAQTNGGNAADLFSVPTGIYQTNISQILPAGSYQLYVYAVGKACIRNHLSPPVAYTETYTGGLPFPWNNEDIGSVGVNGSTTFTNGIFTVQGSGADIWGSSDAFQYADQQLGGSNGQIVAEVDSINAANPWAKAALMFRSSLTANSANGLIAVTPGNGVSMQSRTNTGGSTATVNTTSTNLAAPYWISLVLEADVLTGYASPDGMNWTPVGTNIISLGANPYVGMAVTSKSNSVLNTSTFGNVTVATPNPNLPFPWLSADIGNPTLTGSSGDANGLFTVAGSGTDIWGTSDQFQYAYQPWIGDGQIVVQVDTVSNTASYAKAAIMFRNSLDPASDNTLICVTPTAGVTMQCRTNYGGETFTLGTNTGTAPYWIKLVSQGGVLTGYSSPDGMNWTAVGTNTVALSTNYYVGMAVTSKSSSALNTSTFTNVALSNPDVNYSYTAGWATPANISYGTPLGVSQTNATASVAGTFVYSPAGGTYLPAGTTNLTVVFTPSNPDYAPTNLSVPLIVTPAALAITANNQGKVYNTTLTLGAGQTAFTSAGLQLGDTVGSVTLSSSGAVNTAPVGTYPIMPSSATGGTFNANNYSITYDNGTLTVGVGSYTAGWATPSSIVYGTALGSGQNDATASVAGSFVYNPANGTYLMAGTNVLTTAFTPSNTNYLGTNLTVQLVVTPAALTITANNLGKLYGTTLTLGAGQTAFTSAGLVLGDTVGSVTLASSGAVSTALVGTYPIVPSLATGGTFNPNNYGITYDDGTLTVYTNGSLPPPWLNQDIGSVGVGGSSTYSNGTFFVSGSGVDIWGSSDSFQFAYQPWSGDGQIVVRVASVQNTSPWAKGAIMFRETLNSNSVNSLIFVSPTSGISMQSRTNTGGTTATVNTIAGAPPSWLSLVRLGNVLTGYSSADGVNWTPVGTNTVTMATNLYVGLAVTSKSNTVLNASVFDHVDVDNVWLSQDIGSVGVAGDSQINYSNGVVTMQGAGTDIWGSSDSFQFLYQAGSGDSSIIARVTGVQNTSPWAKAAVMIRETLSTNSRNSILFLSPSNGVQLQGRTATGGSTVSIVNITNPVAPEWLQLVRSSANMNAYISADGANWFWIGTQSNSMATSYYIGLADTSKTNTELNTSTFDNVSVGSAWTSGDIGSVGVAGSTTINDSTGTFTVSGSGTDIWSTNDAFQFVGQPLYGDGQIVAQVLTISNTAPWAKAGVMVRDTVLPGAMNALLFVSPTNGVEFQGRTSTGGTTSSFQITTGITVPCWLKLVRSGSSLTAFQSGDDVTWTAVGAAETIDISTNAWIGLAVGSKNNTVLNTSTFSNVTVTPMP